MMPSLAIEVLILGGGPAAFAATLALARSGRRVAVATRSRNHQGGTGETLAADALPWLDQLGLLDRFASLPKIASTGVLSLWEGPEPSETDAISQPHGVGWHLDRDLFDAMLATAARASGAVVLEGVTLREIQAQPGSGSADWTLRADRTNGPVILSAPLVIDATGRSRWLARRLGVESRTLDRLVALSAVSDHSGSLDDRLVMEAEPDGWWYTIPLAGRRRLVVLITDHDLLEPDPSARAQDWRRRLASTQWIAPRLGSIPPGLTPRVRTAATSRLSRFHGRGWLAVGDAARTVDPLAGLGLRRALGSGVESARTTIAGMTDAAAALEFEDCADLTAQTRLYETVGRWPDRPFWVRRRASQLGFPRQHKTADHGRFG